ncbi:rubrerythrin family protein [Candidatus Micrarchaeota archaeon]|jgi:rubrerythrin|nr:rubrerythrin family protein [Candidatus Micrarchaeota archaeon]
MQKTLENLTKAFIGESQARNRYTMYASTARKEGYQQISEIFTITADNEIEHAEWLWKMIKQIKKDLKMTNEEMDKPMIVEADSPQIWETTLDNLKSAADGENHEFEQMYPSFAQTAEEEGLKDVAVRLRAIAKAEQHHRDRFRKLIKEVENNTVFKKDAPVMWFCRKCGYWYEGPKAPEKCPSCGHDQSYYQRMCEEY